MVFYLFNLFATWGTSNSLTRPGPMFKHGTDVNGADWLVMEVKYNARSLANSSAGLSMITPDFKFSPT